MKKVIIVFTLGLLSGMIPTWLEEAWGDSILSLIGPGIVFGIILGTYFFITEKTKLGKVLLWLVSSMIASTVAIYITIVMMTIFFDNNKISLAPCFAIGGLIGTIILLMGTRLFIHKINFKHSITILIIGTISGLLFGFLFDTLGTPYYAVWQAPIALGLCFLKIPTDNNNVKNTAEETPI